MCLLNSLFDLLKGGKCLSMNIMSDISLYVFAVWWVVPDDSSLSVSFASGCN